YMIASSKGRPPRTNEPAIGVTTAKAATHTTLAQATAASSHTARVALGRRGTSIRTKAAIPRYETKHRISPGAGKVTAVTVWPALTVAEPAAHSATAAVSTTRELRRVRATVAVRANRASITRNIDAIVTSSIMRIGPLSARPPWITAVVAPAANSTQGAGPSTLAMVAARRSGT